MYDNEVKKISDVEMFRYPAQLEENLNILYREKGKFNIVAFCYNLPPTGRFVNVTGAYDFSTSVSLKQGNQIYLVPNPGKSNLCVKCKMLLVCRGSMFDKHTR